MKCVSDLKYADDNIRAFHAAVDAGNLQEVEEMLAKEDVEAADTACKVRPIHIAAVKGHLDILNVLIARGCDVNAQAFFDSPWTRVVESGMTPLHLAASNVDPNLALALINAGANVNAKSGSGACPLHIATMNGHLPVVKVLVSANADAQAQDNMKETPLLTAVKREFEDVATFLVESGALVNARNSHRSGPLHFAAHRGNVNITKLLIQNEAVKNARNRSGYTPLILAIQHRKFEVTQFLINNGADVKASDKDGATPLHYAAHRGFPVETVRLLIAEGADVNARERVGRTPLYFAAENDFTDIVNVLIENKADVNATGDFKWTSLHGAAYKGSLDSAKILIANGAEVDSKTGQLATPLHFAAYYWHVEIVTYLLAEGADVNAPDIANCTPLHFAIVDESEMNVPPRNSVHLAERTPDSNLNTVKALIQNGADVNATGRNDDDTPLHFALRSNDPVIVRCLLDNGANYDPNYQVVIGNEPASSVAAMKRKETINLLCSVEKLFRAVKRAKCSEIEKCVEEGAPVNSGSTKYGTPLTYASWKGHLAVVNVLLKNGASVNLGTSNCITPLHYASKFGHHEILCVLLQHGAVYNARTKPGKKTPLNFAREDRKKVVADTLEMIERMFIRVSIKDKTVLKDLNELKDTKCAEFLAIKNCKNVNGETLSQISSKTEYEELCELFSDL